MKLIKMSFQLVLLLVIYLRVQLIQSSSPTIKSASTSGNQQSSVSARSRSYQKQPLFNKPFGLLNPAGCCPCNECCSCEPDYLDDEPAQTGIPVPTLPGVPLFNRYGSSSSSTRKALVVRRRYVRPNGALVVEVEEQPVSSTRNGGSLGVGGGNGGSSIFGGNGGFFSRFLPSALEKSTSRSKQINRLESNSNFSPLLEEDSTQLIVPSALISKNNSLINQKLPQRKHN